MFFIFHNNFVNNHCCWRHERCKNRGNSRSALELLLCLYCSRFRWFQARASCKFKRSYNLIVFFIFLSGHDRRSYWLSRGRKFATFSHMCTFEYNICLIPSQITLKCEFRNVMVRRTDAKRRKETRQDRFMPPPPQVKDCTHNSTTKREVCWIIQKKVTATDILHIMFDRYEIKD